jgi:hypothetical protein
MRLNLGPEAKRFYEEMKPEFDQAKALIAIEAIKDLLREEIKVSRQRSVRQTFVITQCVLDLIDAISDRG